MRRFPLSLTIVLILGMFFLSMIVNDEKALPLQVPIDPCAEKQRAFIGGEVITYELFYNWNFVWVSAGLVTFTVEETPDHFHVMVRGKTHDSYEWFYKVKDRYDTWIDKKTLLPVLYIRETDEGGFKVYERVEFDQQRGKATSVKGQNKATATPQIVPLSGCMHDIVSIIYTARSLDYSTMKSGEKIPIQVYLDREIYPLKMAFKGKDSRVKVKAQGIFKTIKLSPEVVSGTVFDANTQLNIWATDDGNKMPVLIESPISVGSIKAVLKSYKGLQYPMTSKNN
ncbi:MAG: DUF3108 domain-containing protein [Saprospiraceae bacterium]